MTKAKYFYELPPKELAKEIFKSLENNLTGKDQDTYIESLNCYLGGLNNEAHHKVMVNEALDKANDEERKAKYMPNESVKFIFNFNVHKGRIQSIHHNVARHDVVYVIEERKVFGCNQYNHYEGHHFYIPEEDIISASVKEQPKPKEEEYKTKFEVGERAVLKPDINGIPPRRIVSIKTINTEYFSSRPKITTYEVKENIIYAPGITVEPIWVHEENLYKLNDPEIIYAGDKLRVTIGHHAVRHHALFLKEGAVVVMEGFFIVKEKGEEEHCVRCTYQTTQVTVHITIPLKYLELVLD